VGPTATDVLRFDRQAAAPIVSRERSLRRSGDALNTREPRIVHHSVGPITGRRLRWKAGVIALIALTVWMGALRPLARVAGHTHNVLGFARVALLSDPAADGDAPLKPPGRAAVQAIVPALVSALLIALKTRRTAFVPVPVRRLKLPPHRSTDSLPSEPPTSE